jgi:DNA polymerase III epsilon subunit-like protein
MNMPRIISENCFAVFDTETTGLSTKTDQIIQFGLAQVDCGAPRLQVTCKLQPTVPVKDRAAQVHGMTAHTLRHAPPFAEVARDLLSLIGDRCLLGWSVKKFDMPLLQRQLEELEIPWQPARMIDAVLWDRHFCPDRKHALAVAAAQWGVPMVGAHDALADCRTAWGVFCQMALHTELGSMTLAQALEAQDNL